MRVLHFYKTSYPDTMGGVEQLIHQLAAGSSELGVETQVLSLTSASDLSSIRVSGYQVHRARTDLHLASTSISVSALRKFSELSKSVDVIHYHFPWPFMDVAHFIFAAKKPSIVTYHSDIVRQKTLLRFYRPLMHLFLGRVDRIVATSANYLESSDVLRKYREKVEVIPIGLDKSSYCEPDAEKVSYWGSRLGAKFFLFVGVIRYYKGLHILLEAIRGAEFPVVIIGSGPVEEELRAQAHKQNLRNVYFLGHLPDADKVALLRLSYAIVFPSHLRSEAFGVTLLEGAMFGKPLISSEIGTGTSYVNVHGETGLVVPPGDSEALRKAMEYLWAHPQQAGRMGGLAEARYWKHFTAGKMVADYVKLYTELSKRE